MGQEMIIPIAMFLMIFGIVYVFLTTRNKERLALIEKGADAGVFTKGKSTTGAGGRLIILNLACLLMGIGIGVFVALILERYTSLDPDGIYPACIFTMAGLGLFIGFTLSKRLDHQSDI